MDNNDTNDRQHDHASWCDTAGHTDLALGCASTVTRLHGTASWIAPAPTNGTAPAPGLYLEARVLGLGAPGVAALIEHLTAVLHHLN